MNEVTRILSQIEGGDPQAAAQLLPLVYQELRQLAARHLAHEKPGQTLQATALVHEAYLRLVDGNADRKVDGNQQQKWDGRGHFFAAAAEAMRRILVEQARRKNRIRHGGDMLRVELGDPAVADDGLAERMIEVDTALSRLAIEDPQAAEVVNLHYFAGLSLEEVGTLLGTSRATAYRQWTYARSWLKIEIER